MKLALYNYWRSSASYRVRIALALKQLPYEYVAVNLLTRDQQRDGYVAKNPFGQVPMLEVTDDSGTVRMLTQSLAILEFLEEVHPNPPLLPSDPYQRATARALAETINAGIQPLYNLSTTDEVKAIGGDDVAWVRRFITRGLAALERAVAGSAGTFCVGDAPSFADCCLIPQLASSRRFGVDLTPYRGLLEVETRCLALPAFAAAAPERQPDAVAS